MVRTADLVLLAWLVFLAGRAFGENFIAGADVSHLKFFEDRGVVYRDDGQVGDALEILQRRGVNCVRLRLFTSSTAQALADPYNRINNLDYTLALAVRSRQAGLKVLLDFHYSDTWADPGKQTKPAAWANLSFTELEQRMVEYNSNCISSFRAAGVMPDYVQMGNEITSGMLWPEGRVGGAYENATQWSQFGRLIKAAIRGIHDASGPQRPKIIIHIDRGGDWAATQWYFDNLQRQQVEFDIIGQSYYPFWHGDLNALSNCLHRAAGRYAKPLIIMETAFPWANSGNVVGFPATPTGQSDYVLQLAKILKSVPDGLGTGIFWWGTEYQHLDRVQTAGFEFRGFFNAEGDVLPAARTLGQLSTPVVLKAALTGTDQITLHWPLSGAGLALVNSPSLLSSELWRPTNPPIETNTLTFETTLPVGDEPVSFFRLQAN
ncbi:MAG TPA: glycosyl hydrolase 53 family protein [Verrucomicrobiota bacterium]|nr:glycosyl hydrolase 53 family protein [Verrucomicrobiota bacterium]